MVKVVCIKCKEIGYTASPNFVICDCGGHLIAATDKVCRSRKRSKNSK